jgi:hypothetical protein
MTRSRDLSNDQANVGGAVAPFVAGKNKIINGDFNIWQRGTSFSNPSGAYTADRWLPLWDGSGGTRTVTQQAFTPGTAPVSGYEGQYFLRFAQSVAGTGGTYNVVNHRIEDVRTFAGQTVTFSFWAKASSSISMSQAPQLNQNFGSGGSSTVYQGFPGATAPALTTSWQRFTFTTTLPSVSGKTIGTSSFLEVGFNLLLNTTFTIDVWGAQLEAGSVATPFTTASGTLQGELALCQRYYWRVATNGGSPVTNLIAPAAGITSSQIWAGLQMPVTMRATPTLDSNSGTNYFAYYCNSAFTYMTSLTLNDATATTVTVRNISTSATAGQAGFLYLYQSNSYIGLSAEL